MRRFGTERYTSVAARCEVNSPRAAYLSRAARTRFAFAFADDVSRIDSTVKTRRRLTAAAVRQCESDPASIIVYDVPEPSRSEVWADRLDDQEC